MAFIQDGIKYFHELAKTAEKFITTLGLILVTQVIKKTICYYQATVKHQENYDNYHHNSK